MLKGILVYAEIGSHCEISNNSNLILITISTNVPLVTSNSGMYKYLKTRRLEEPRAAVTTIGH